MTTGKRKGRSIFSLIWLGFLLQLVLVILTAGYFSYSQSHKLAMESVQAQLEATGRTVQHDFAGSYAQPILRDMRVLGAAPEINRLMMSPKDQELVHQIDAEKLFAGFSNGRARLLFIKFLDSRGRELAGVVAGKRLRRFRDFEALDMNIALDRCQKELFEALRNSPTGTVRAGPLFNDTEGRVGFLVGVSVLEPEAGGFGGAILQHYDAQPFLSALSETHIFDSRAFWAYDGHTGDILSSLEGAQTAQAPFERLPVAAWPAGTLRIPCVVREGDTPVLVVAGSLSERVIARQVDPVVTTVIQVFIGLSLLAVALAYLTARSVSRPLSRIAQAVRTIGKGNLDATIGEVGGGEAGELAHLLDRMTSDLRQTTVSRDDLLSEVAQRTRAEEELRKQALQLQSANAAMEREKDKAQRYLELAGVMFIALDTGGHVILANRKACEVLETNEDRLLGSDWFSTWLPEEAKVNVRAVFEQILHGEKEGVERFENPVCTATGKTRIIRWHNTYITDQDGRIVGSLGSGEDVTDQRQLEQQLAQAQKLESIGSMAAGIAHEINTPTQYVSDNTSFLKEAFGDLGRLIQAHQRLCEAVKSGEPTVDVAIKEAEEVARKIDVEYLMEEVPKSIRQSQEGLTRVAEIVRAMKEFSHPSSKEKKPVDLNQAIRTTATVARNEWKYVAELKLDLEVALPPVPALPGEINQTLLNIIVNAAHAIGDVVKEKPGEKGQIAISTRKLDGCVEIRIADTGGGIPEKVRARVFDPFFTTKGVGKGTGQGLTIAHSVVVSKHGGTLDFETAEGRGTTFVIRLPLNESPQQETVA